MGDENIILSEKVYQMKQPVKVLHLAGEYLVSSSADCKIRTWAIDDMSGEITLKATLKGHVGPPTRLKTDGDVLFSLSSRDETLRTWSLSESKLLKEFKGHEKYLTDMAIARKDGIVYTASFDGKIIGWNWQTGEKLVTFDGHKDSVVKIKVSGKHLISCSADRSVRIWTRKNGECLHTLEGHNSFVLGVRVHEKQIYSNSQDGTIRVWSIKSGELKKTIEIGSPIQRMHLSTKWVCAMDGKQLLLYNKEKPSKTPAGTLEGHTAAVLGVTWYKETAFTVSADQTARVWSMKKSKLAGVLRGHAGAVNDVVVSNRHVYTAGQDGSIRLWLNSKWLREEQDGWF